MLDVGANYVASIIAAGLGLSFMAADWRTVNSRFLGGFLICFGITGAVNSVFYQYGAVADLPSWHIYTGIPVGFTIFFAAEWLLRIRRTIPAGDLRTTVGDWQIRIAQAGGFIYAAITLVLHEERAELVMFGIGRADALSDPWFWTFAIPFSVPVLLVSLSAILTLNRRPDRPEMIRLVTLIIAAPFMVSGFYLPPEYAPYLVSIGLIIFVTGAIEYHIIQGQRGAFMGRFLAPQVADIVKREGLEASLQEKSQDLTVVYCDLRGFTAWSEDHTSSEVIGLLREYYDIVGDAAARHEATIKDYAGDGVMLLVGAPLPCEDHAIRGIRLGVEIRDRVGILLSRHRQPEHPLGVGVGIASGIVSVGVVGGNRLEYAAVGSTVNLAARLCEQAASSQIRLAADTQAAIGDESFGFIIESLPKVELKGWQLPVNNYGIT